MFELRSHGEGCHRVEPDRLAGVALGLDNRNYLGDRVALIEAYVDAAIMRSRPQFGAEPLIAEDGVEKLLEPPPVQPLESFRVLREMREHLGVKIVQTLGRKLLDPLPAMQLQIVTPPRLRRRK